MGAVKLGLGWFVSIIIVIVLLFAGTIVWLITLPVDKNRTIIHCILNYCSLILVRILPIWRLEITGRDKANSRGTYIIISNHQSVLDIIMLNCLRYRFKWVSKIENLRVAGLGCFIKMADYIIIDRGNPESRDLLYEKARNFLKRGVSVMMFPEGTRSGDMEIHFFKRGAFKLAIENNIPILPIVIYGTGGILHKGGLSLGREHKIVIKVLDPVTPENFGTTDYDNLATRFQLMITETYKEIKGE